MVTRTARREPEQGKRHCGQNSRDTARQRSLGKEWKQTTNNSEELGHQDLGMIRGPRPPRHNIRMTRKGA